MQTPVDFFMPFIQAFGPAGVSFAIMLWIMLRSGKQCEERIKQLEEHQAQQYNKTIDLQKETIKDYSNLVQTNTKVLSDLTNCLHAMKDTLDHIDRRPS